MVDCPSRRDISNAIARRESKAVSLEDEDMLTALVELKMEGSSITPEQERKYEALQEKRRLWAEESQEMLLYQQSNENMFGYVFAASGLQDTNVRSTAQTQDQPSIMDWALIKPYRSRPPFTTEVILLTMPHSFEPG